MEYPTLKMTVYGIHQRVSMVLFTRIKAPPNLLTLMEMSHLLNSHSRQTTDTGEAPPRSSCDMLHLFSLSFPE